MRHRAPALPADDAIPEAMGLMKDNHRYRVLHPLAGTLYPTTKFSSTYLFIGRAGVVSWDPCLEIRATKGKFQ